MYQFVRLNLVKYVSQAMGNGQARVESGGSVRVNLANVNEYRTESDGTTRVMYANGTTIHVVESQETIHRLSEGRTK